MTSERNHLSIGEVLSLLQPEFPDITISKIRFLESQGLLDPERTPSGYRKFHDDDIGQLRWILTQQRDHFLPLKVIKERLAAGDLGGGTPEGVLPLGTEPATSAAGAGGATATAVEDAPPPSGGGARAEGDGGDGDDGGGGPGDAVPDPGSEEASGGAGPADETTSGGAAAGPDAPPAAEPGEGSEPTDAPAAVSSNGTAVHEHDRAEAVGRLVEAPDSPEEVEAEAPETTPKGRRRHPTGHQPGEPTPEPGAGAEPEPEVRAQTLTLEELTERSGLSPREVGELERFGLIAGEGDGQATAYDEECLVVARLAAGFGRYGIEPRHLRMYKVAAEREAGLFEQLISPLLKQRRSSARQQAVEMLEDLAELADDLRAAMVRSALRDYLGGD